MGGEQHRHEGGETVRRFKLSLCAARPGNQFIEFDTKVVNRLRIFFQQGGKIELSYSGYGGLPEPVPSLVPPKGSVVIVQITKPSPIFWTCRFDPGQRCVQSRTQIVLFGCEFVPPDNVIAALIREAFQSNDSEEVGVGLTRAHE